MFYKQRGLWWSCSEFPSSLRRELRRDSLGRSRLGITNYVVTFFRRNFRNYDVIRFFRKAKNVAAPGLHGQQSQELSTVPNELIPKMLHLRLHLAYL